jgi:hypothetical protein
MKQLNTLAFLYEILTLVLCTYVSVSTPSQTFFDKTHYTDRQTERQADRRTDRQTDGRIQRERETVITSHFRKTDRKRIEKQR